MGLLSNARMKSIDSSMLGVMHSVLSRVSTHSLGWVPSTGLSNAIIAAARSRKFQREFNPHIGVNSRWLPTSP